MDTQSFHYSFSGSTIPPLDLDTKDGLRAPKDTPSWMWNVAGIFWLESFKDIDTEREGERRRFISMWLHPKICILLLSENILNRLRECLYSFSQHPVSECGSALLCTKQSWNTGSRSLTISDCFPCSITAVVQCQEIANKSWECFNSSSSSQSAFRST
jgi:hypothetical protein